MFLVCGEALWDLFAVPPEAGARDQARSGLRFDARIGGSPFNVAVGLARLGHPAALLTGISTDRLGRRLEAALAAEGVTTGFLRRSDRPTTLSLVDLSENGAPAYAFYGEGAADRALTPGDLPPLGEEVWGIHAGSFSLVTEPVGATLLGLLAAETGRRLISLDPNVRLAVEPDRRLWRRRVEAFVATADLVKVSEEDLALLYPGAGVDGVAARWRAAGAALVVVTRGAEGAEAFAPAGRVGVPGRRVVVADTVGAGDAFQAALIGGLAERGVRRRAALEALGREALADLLGFAAAAAAVTCTRRGADLPRRAEVPAAGRA